MPKFLHYAILLLLAFPIAVAARGPQLANAASALSQVVKEKALLLVINEDAGLIAWADPSLDITTEVVKHLNQP